MPGSHHLRQVIGTEPEDDSFSNSAKLSREENNGTITRHSPFALGHAEICLQIYRDLPMGKDTLHDSVRAKTTVGIGELGEGMARQIIPTIDRKAAGSCQQLLPLW